MVKELKKVIGSTLSNGKGVALAMPTENLVKAATFQQEEIYESLHSSPNGLDEDTISDKREEFGYNRVKREETPSWFKQLLSAFINPFIGVLALIAIVSLTIDVWLATPEERDYKTVIVVVVMVFISVILRFVQ